MEATPSENVESEASFCEIEIKKFSLGARHGTRGGQE